MRLAEPTQHVALSLAEYDEVDGEKLDDEEMDDEKTDYDDYDKDNFCLGPKQGEEDPPQ